MGSLVLLLVWVAANGTRNISPEEMEINSIKYMVHFEGAAMDF